MSAETFIKSLGAHILKEHQEGVVPKDVLAETLTTAVNKLPKGKLKLEMKKGFKKHLKTLKKGIKKLQIEEKAIPDVVEESPLDRSLAELSEHENRAEEIPPPSSPKFHLAYNLYGKTIKPPHESRLQKLPRDQQRNVYCMYLRQLLEREDTTVVNITDVLKKLSSFQQDDESESKSRFDWLAPVTWLHMLAPRTPEATITVLEVLFGQVQPDVETCIMKSKTVRARRLATNLRKFICINYMKISLPSLKPAQVKQYTRLMSGLLSFYIDLCLVYSPDDPKQSGREVCGFVVYILGRWPEMVVEVVLQLCAITGDSATFLLPLIRHSMSSKPTGDAQYLKYVLLVRMVKHELEPDITAQFIIPTMEIAAPASFLAWLQDSCPDAFDKMPTDNRKFKGRKVTKYILEEADEDLIAMLMDNLRDPEVLEDTTPVLEVQTDGQTLPPEQATAREGPLFYIDKSGGKLANLANEEGKADESQAESEASLIVVDAFRDIEELIDKDESTKTYKLSDSLIKRMRARSAKEFLKEGIVYIKSIKTPDSTEQTGEMENTTELLDLSNADTTMTESENKIRPGEESIIDLDSDVNESEMSNAAEGKKSKLFIEMETESDISVSNANEHEKGKKTKLKSIVTKITPVKESIVVSEETTASSVTESETEYDPSEPTMSGIESSASTINLCSQSDPNETETEIETDTTSAFLTSSFDSERTIKATAKHKNVIADSDAETDKDEELQIQSHSRKERGKEDNNQTKYPANKGKKKSIDKDPRSATSKRKTSGDESHSEENKSIGSDAETDMSKEEKLSGTKSPCVSTRKTTASASSKTSESEVTKTHKYVDEKPKRGSSTKSLKTDSSDAETSNAEVFESPQSSPRKGRSSQRVSKQSEDRSLSASSKTKKSSLGEDPVFPFVYSAKKSAEFSSTSSFGSVGKLSRTKLSSSDSKADHEDCIIAQPLSFPTPPAVKAILASPSKKQAHMHGAGLVTEIFTTDTEMETDLEHVGKDSVKGKAVEIDIDEEKNDSDTVDPKPSSPEMLQKKQIVSKSNVKDIQDKFISKAEKNKTPKKKSGSVNLDNSDSVIAVEQTETIDVDNDSNSSNVSVPRPKKLTPQKMSEILNDTKMNGGDVNENNKPSQKKKETEQRKVKCTDEGEQHGKKQQRSKSAGVVGSSSVKKSNKKRVCSVPDKPSGEVDINTSAFIWSKVPVYDQEEAKHKKKTPTKIQVTDSEDTKYTSQKQSSVDDIAEKMDDSLTVAESPVSKTDGSRMESNSEAESEIVGAESVEEVGAKATVRKLKTPKKTPKKTPEYIRAKKSDAEIKSPKSDKSDKTKIILLLDSDNESESEFVGKEKEDIATLTVLNTSDDSDEIVQVKKIKTPMKSESPQSVELEADNEPFENDVSVDKRNKKVKTPIKSPENNTENSESANSINKQEQRKKSLESSEVAKIDKKNKTPIKSPTGNEDGDEAVNSTDRKNIRKKSLESAKKPIADKEDGKIKTPMKSSSDSADNVETPVLDKKDKKMKTPRKSLPSSEMDSKESHKNDGDEIQVIEKQDTKVKTPRKSDTSHLNGIESENVIETVKDNEVCLRHLPSPSAKTKRSYDKEIDIVVPSSQKKGNQSPESSEFTRLHTKIKIPNPNTLASDSEADLDVVPNISQHLKSPHVPVIPDNVEKDSETRGRRSLRPRRQSVMESESETETTQRKRGRAKKEPEGKTATTPAAKKKKSDKKVSVASKEDEIKSETPEENTDSKSTRVTRRRSVLLKTLKTPPQRMASMERKLSASTSKKDVLKTERQKTAGRKRRLSGEMLASDKGSNRDSPDSEVTFPKFKKVPSVKPIPATSRTPKRASTAAKKGTEPKPGASDTKSGYSLRKK